jgi:hypothetical protein
VTAVVGGYLFGTLIWRVAEARYEIWKQQADKIPERFEPGTSRFTEIVSERIQVRKEGTGEQQETSQAQEKMYREGEE